MGKCGSGHRVPQAVLSTADPRQACVVCCGCLFASSLWDLVLRPSFAADVDNPSFAADVDIPSSAADVDNPSSAADVGFLSSAADDDNRLLLLFISLLLLLFMNNTSLFTTLPQTTRHSTTPPQTTRHSLRHCLSHKEDDMVLLKTEEFELVFHVSLFTSSSVSQSGPYRPPGGVEEMQGGGRRVRLEWGAYITV
ncbi:hypothetical protein FHG87_016151 [Trinorchestia longiramus]|nr:hypothetical protein FHG87_016151 [Trinorchestia longiramus]